MCGGWRRRGCTISPNGIDTARSAAAVPVDRSLLAGLGEGPVIGTIAALRPEKNLSRLIAAFARLQKSMPARLVIVGDGVERIALERLAYRLGVTRHVLFAGYSAAPESWMAAFDIFALSSDTEQMPLSVLEAMAAGLPVVATDVGDVRLMVAAENRRLIVPRDEDSMADALGRAVIMARAGATGAANRARVVAEFDQAAMFASYRALLGIV